MQYSIRLKNIPETDQLVFKLIFSLSEKAHGRNCSYKVNDLGAAGRGEVIIDGLDDHTGQTGGSTILFDTTGIVPANRQYVIRKPLIATRVLRILDDYIAKESPLINVETTTEPAASHTASEAGAVADDIEFCITEQEASELAIVDDEALSNPGNSLLVLEDDVRPAQAVVNTLPPKPTASLLRLHLDKKETLAESTADVTAASERQRPRALVVDDSPSVRKQIELELDLFNVDVDYAVDMHQALELAEKYKYQVAFLDVVLPDGDGFQICKKIKQEILGISVIMLTGKASPADKIKGTMVGCDAYLVKPVGRMTFQNTVCKFLQLRKQLDAVRA